MKSCSRPRAIARGLLGLAIAGAFVAAELPAAAPSAADEPAGTTQTLLADELQTAHSPAWHLNHGEWKIVDGGFRAIEDPAEKHSAAARYRTGVLFTDTTFEYEFRLDGATMTALSINDMTRHLCRARIGRGAVQVLKDDADGPGPETSAVVASTKTTIEPGTWHRLKITFVGDEMTVDVDGVIAKGRHPQFAEPKENFALIVGGNSTSFRRFRAVVPAGSTKPAPPRQPRKARDAGSSSQTSAAGEPPAAGTASAARQPTRRDRPVGCFEREERP